MITIESIAVENLRGYSHTELALNNLTVLVGENNEGKSSLLKMLEHFMEMKPEFWDGDRALSEEDRDFWTPANDTRHKARRFIAYLKFEDGRMARRYGANRSKAFPLRLAIDSSGYCRLNIGSPKRGESHDIKAVELKRRLGEHVRLVFLPPIRDAKSSTFTKKVTHKVNQRLKTKMVHSKQAGAPQEYRIAKEVISKIKQIVELQSGALSLSDNSPLASMLKSSEVRVDLFPKDIYSLIEKSMYVYLSTGAHDELKVLPSEVGNGLQSIIDINLTVESILNSSSDVNVIVIIEEPEAFLHPSAQRQFMLFLRRALVGKVQSAILTTHSPIIVDEATYEEIVLVRNQKHFAPIDAPENRASINTSLMTIASSEVFFARTVVLLEGEGDRAFFNTLLRRIKKTATVCSEITGLVFQPTGGCTSYAPWLKLSRSYRRAGEDPFDCLWIMDGDAATGDRPILRAASDCNFSFHHHEHDAIVNFGNLAWDVAARSPSCNSEANKALVKHGGHLFCCDLEWGLFNGASYNAIRGIKKALRLANISDVGNSVELARRLGSKIRDGNSQDGAKKAPFIRALIAEQIELSELPPEIYLALRQIFLTCYKNNTRAVDDLFAACGIANA